MRAIGRRNDFCGAFAKIALVARNESRVSSIKKYLEKEERAYTIPALLSLETVAFTDDKEHRKYIKIVLDLLSTTEEPTVLAALAVALGAIGDRTAHRALEKQLQKKLDEWVRIEIEKALMHIESRSRNE